jgi:YggT family protein
MAALLYLLDTLLSLALLPFLLRLLLQWSRADFRNPLAKALVQITNPVLVPLRRLLPALGRVDTASVVVIVALVVLRVGIERSFAGSGLPQLLPWLYLAASSLLQTVLWTYFLALVLYSLLSFAAQDGYNPAQALLQSLCEPLLRPIRRVIPPLGGIDFSPLWLCIAIQVILRLLP